MSKAKTIAERMDKDPGGVLGEYIMLKARVEAMEGELKKWVDRNGVLYSVTPTPASYRKISRSKKTLDGKKVVAFLDEHCIDPLSMGSVSITEQSIVAALGKEEGAKVIADLRKGGCIKTAEYSYYALKVNTE